MDRSGECGRLDTGSVDRRAVSKREVEIMCVWEVRVRESVLNYCLFIKTKSKVRFEASAR